MGKFVAPTGIEVSFDEYDMIVSKADSKGRFTDVNKTFCDVAGYHESDLLGQPHNIIRHPDMPRVKLSWDAVFDGCEVFRYLKNRTRSGAYYCVFANLTPSIKGNQPSSAFAQVAALAIGGFSRVSSFLRRHAARREIAPQC